jgi:predicted AlkP superfamily phosphohydrolase/phosphomutase
MPDNGKVVIIGLDGATFGLLRPLVDAGFMPTVGRFMSEGAWGNLLSTRPPVTCPAWPSMYTGVGPGKHGVFSFSHRDAVTGRVRTAASTDVRVPKLWDLVGDAGRTSAVLNVPITFPAQPLKGVTLTGFVSPDDSPHVSYPASLADELRETLGDLKLNWTVLGFRPADIEKREEHVRKINQLMAARVAQFEHILDRNPCDLCYMVHEYPDRVYHLYQHILDPAYPAHADPANASTLAMLREGHRALDESIHRMMERFGLETNYLIVSDHGFGGVTQWVYLNNLLEASQLVRFRSGRVWTELISRHLNLSLKTRERFGVERKELWHRQDPSMAPLVDYQHSQAFAGPQLEHAVYVNLKGRFAEGVVEQRDYPRVRDRIIDALTRAKDPATGLPVFEGVWSREELYPGAYVENAPDVIYELSPGYMVSNSIVPPTLLRGGFLRPLKSGWDISGYHRPEGVFLGWGPAFASVSGFEASILDVTPTVLYLMNLPIPDYMDGDVIRAAMKPALLRNRVRRISHGEPDTVKGEPMPYSDTEQIELTKRLEELGYL